ncbi:MAG: glycoside hydrolase family 127 protein [bacterium]|nr:glycoside hydrolase family 127 protein [bacterium]
MKHQKLTASVCAAAMTVSALPCINVLAASAVNSEAELVSALSTGGEYELTADFQAANAGINSTATTGSLNGNGHTITKSSLMLGDALLYQNCNGSWSFSNLTLDGGKSSVTFTDAALWYMAGNVTFDKVNIQNFKTSSASRYALNCNSSADIILNDTVFSGNENANAAVKESDVYIDGGTLHLSGDTKANIYYAGGAIDISKLTGGCDIKITAADANTYKTLSVLSPGLPSVAMIKDDAARTVTLSRSDIIWSMSAEKTSPDTNGNITISASVHSYSENTRSARLYAAAYGENGALGAVSVTDEFTLSQGTLAPELKLKAADTDKIVLYLWDSENGEPLTDRFEISKTSEENLILSYDFEDISESASVVKGGASVTDGAGISGRGLVFDGVSGHMQLPNNILSENMTISAWIKTDTVQNWARFFDFGSSQTDNFFYSPSGGRVESVCGGVTDTLNLTSFSNTGIWEHYAVTRTNNHVQVYRNGVLVSESACKGAVTNLTEVTNYIGRSHWESDAYFKGTMDDIKIYNKICTAEEIKNMYDEYAIRISKLAAYKDCAVLDFGTTELTGGTVLPASGANGSSIEWNCDDTAVISNNTITAPAAGEADKNVTLRATVTNGGSSYEKDFNITVLAAPSITGLSDYRMSDVLMTNDYLINANAKMNEYLKKFNVDTSVNGFRRTMGVNTSNVTYGGWETSLIAGHGIGHFVSALAQGYNYSTAGEADAELLELSNKMIDDLYKAQAHEDTTVNGASIKKGFLFATTNAWKGGSVVTGEGQFDNVENNRTNITKQAWVPWYTMHKILAGLVDTYKFTGNQKALAMADELGDWVYNRVSKYDSAMQQRVLNIEYGGMNDILYELYKLTGKETHARAAHIFDEISLFDEIYNGNDILANKHANTTIPKIMGALNRYITESNTELTADMLGDSHNADYYLKVAENFFDMVVNDHTYVTGGTGQDEHFRAAGANNAFRDNVNNETCAAYNMLKIARELYKITGDKKYADYYENTFLNSIVASQNPETGMTMYFQPMATGYFKVYSTEFDDFWCCTASGMENFTKLTDSLYYKGENRIVVNQYISSVLNDTENNIKLSQTSEIPEGTVSTFTVEPINGASQTAEITLRIPEWAASMPNIKVNGEEIAYTRSAGYASISREWKIGDKIEIDIPMEVRAYGLSDSETVESFKYGPTVLSVGWDNSDTAEQAHGMAVRKPKNKSDINEYVQINSEYGTREDWLANVNENMVKTDGKLEFTMQNTDNPLVFTPHYSKYKERYGIYWYITDNGEREDEEEKYTIIDSIELAHDQQENGHGYTQENSVGYEATGSMPNYREILNGGYADYQLAVEKDAVNYLSVIYHADDAGKQMSIYAGDTKLADVTAPIGGGEVLYEIPSEIMANTIISDAPTISGLDALHIVFKADCGSDAPKLCGTVKIVKMNE